VPPVATTRVAKPSRPRAERAFHPLKGEETLTKNARAM
jgi:hypothetical protein